MLSIDPDTLAERFRFDAKKHFFDQDQFSHSGSLTVVGAELYFLDRVSFPWQWDDRLSGKITAASTSSR